MDAVDAVGLLAEPVRRRLYDYVVGQDRAVDRAEAAVAAQITRPLAAFHLDKLADAGLLDTDYRRPPGRSGPGAGRPAKVYSPAKTEQVVSLPPRSYHLAAELLAETVAELGGDRELATHARVAGRARSIPARTYQAATAALADRGYAPYRDGNTIRLRNCPFHRLATDHPVLMCGMNLALLDGLLADWHATLDPRPGECCVALRRASKRNRN